MILMRNKRSSQRNSYGFTGMFFLNSDIFLKIYIKREKKSLTIKNVHKKEGSAEGTGSGGLRH